MVNFFKSTLLLITVTVLIVSVLLLDFILFHDDPLIFWISLPVLITVSGLAIGKLLQIRKNEIIYFQLLNDAIDGANRVALVSFPMSLAIVDEDGIIVWHNELFGKQFFDPNEDNNNISFIIDRPIDVFENGENSIEHDGRHYVVYARKLKFTPDERSIASKKAPEVLLNINGMTVLYFKDITDYRNLQDEHRLSEPVVMSIMLDQYEDVQKFTSDSEKAEKLLDVQRVLEGYFGTNAVLRKIADDRYVVVTQERRLREMLDDKMAVLEQVRGIKLGGRSVMSISIGISRDVGNRIDEKEKDSYKALDLAISRGGDQAVIITGSDYQFVGSSNQNSSQYNRVKMSYHAKELRELINSSDAVYIMGHSYGDFDSVGSAIGLACVIRRLGSAANVVVDQENNAAKPLLKCFADYEPYLIMSPEEARAKFTDRSLLIIVDTHIVSKLDDEALFDMASKDRMVVIDHHRMSPGAIQNPAIMLHEPNASSASELVTNLIQHFDVDPILESNEAEALLAGITLDTKDFVMRSGPATFEAAAFLKGLGADTVEVKKLFSITVEQRNKKSEIISTAKIRKRCAIAIVKESFKDIRILCAQVADDMLYISGVDAAFTLYPIGINAWSISARSLGKINVQLIMEKLGSKKGGGHQSMAGGQLFDMSLEDAELKLYEAIDSFFEDANIQ